MEYRCYECGAYGGNQHEWRCSRAVKVKSYKCRKCGEYKGNQHKWWCPDAKKV